MALTLRTDDELDRALTQLSERLRISKQEVIRSAVLEKAERDSHRARVDESSVRMREQWGETLDRLGSV